ncbi:hypothetical protein CK222_30680 [Mesorhizobium sp. WSM3866]|nr:hypothetical protein CK222_30680 [Mesorhizobium sp. WSM3866]
MKEIVRGDLFLLSERQMARISPHFPLSHGVPRVDDRQVVSRTVNVIRTACSGRKGRRGYGPHNTLNRFIRWSRLGCSTASLPALPAKGRSTSPSLIDATHLFTGEGAGRLTSKSRRQ